MNLTQLKITTAIFTSFALLGNAYAAFPKTNTFTNSQKEAIESIVTDLIDSKPEVIKNALKKALFQEEKDKQEKIKKVIAEHKAEIFEDLMSPVLGNGTKSVAVFMDPFCGYCNQFYKVLKQVQDERKDGLRIVFKILPFLSEDSREIVEELIASNQQGLDLFQKYYEEISGNSSAYNKESRMKIAEKVGLDPVRLRKDSQSPEVRKAIAVNEKLAKEQIKIGGTPAFIVSTDNTLVVGLVNAENFNKILDAPKGKKQRG